MYSLRNKKIIFELSSIPPLIWSCGKDLQKMYCIVNSGNTQQLHLLMFINNVPFVINEHCFR